MSIERKLIGTTDGVAYTPTYIEDVFSTYLYAGNGSTQTINNGIDLATKGGMVWLKSRSSVGSGAIIDTARGRDKISFSSDTASYTSAADKDLSSFNTDGFSLGLNNQGVVNSSGDTFASWTFRKQPKFFDVVTYTGTGSARTIAHSLGATPGMIIVKRTDSTGNWAVFHKSRSYTNVLYLNSTVAASSSTVWGSNPTVSDFSVTSSSTVNASGGTYVAYLFADSNSGGFGAAGTDSVVACGSFTGNTTVNLGWEPQLLIVKRTDTTGNWQIIDNMRGMPVIADYTGSQQVLFANTSGSESTSGIASPNSTGFNPVSSVGTYIYLAIRRGPMKTPTDATKVFSPITSSAATGTTLTTGFPVDVQIAAIRGGGASTSPFVLDRLRGVSTKYTAATDQLDYHLTTSSSAAEVAAGDYYSNFWDSVGFNTPAFTSNNSSIYWNFKRAPGFFDVVCWSGTITANFQTQTISHNLGSVPTLLILKNRTRAASNHAWATYVESLGNNKGLVLNTNVSSFGVSWWGNTTPNAATFTVAGYASGPDIGPISTTAGDAYVAYLFATCPGVSKVFSFTGNGSSQTIDCGFTSGARFVLIKRTDSTGDWWVYDSARGIVSAADPALRLNSTAAEVTSADAIDPASSGFIVNQETTCNVNVNNATYIGLAIA